MRTLIAVFTTVALSALIGLSQEPKTKIKKVTPEYTSPGSGPDMFRQYCAVCHGADGKGTGPAAEALKKAPADLTALAKKNGGKFPTYKVQEFIKGDTAIPSHGSREMPVWGDIFRSLERDSRLVTMRIHNLSGYIEGIQQK